MSEPQGPAARGQKIARATEKEPPERVPPSHLRAVQEFFRQLVITEKNLGLYPPFSKVVQSSLAKLHKATVAMLEEVGVLRLQVSQEGFHYKEEVVYFEATRAKSLSFRIYKDGVRDITVLPEVTQDELAAFVQCLKEAKKVDEDEDDFVTLFWEKDCANIQVQLADDFLSNEDLPPIPENRIGLDTLALQRFKVPPQEKERLLEALENRKEDGGDSTFELTEEEAGHLKELVRNEEVYFPLFDFVDILLEVMVRNPEPEAFSRSVKMLRTIIAAVIEDHDFERAADLMKKLSEETHPGLSQHHRHQLREMLETFTDKQTLTVLETFLKENDRLAPDHPVFGFMKSFPRTAVGTFCPFLRHQQHAQGVSKVLIHLGRGASGVFAGYLGDSDSSIVRAMIGVIVEADPEHSAKHLAKALKHPDESVRVYAAKTILEKGDHAAGALFIPLLHEGSKQLLNIALLFFSKVPYPPAYEHLESLIRGRHFHVLDAKRQQSCFKALLRSSYAQGIAFIRGSVLKRTFCLTKASQRKKSAALMSLASSGVKPSREVLEKFARKKRSPLATVARKALVEMERRERHGSSRRRKGSEVRHV